MAPLRDVHVYVDDLRNDWNDRESAGRLRVTVVYRFSHCIQDAARKTRSKLEAGAWKGLVVNTSGGRVTVLATQEKWTN
jgi:hypothetical protein